MRQKNKRNSGTKTESLRLHFDRRCMERLGRVLDHKQLVRDISQGNIKFMMKQSNRVSVFILDIDEVVYRLFYDKSRQTCITIIPNSWFTEEAQLPRLQSLKANEKDAIDLTQMIMQKYDLNWEQARIFLESL